MSTNVTQCGITSELGVQYCSKCRERRVWFAHNKAHTLAGEFLIFCRRGSGLVALFSGFLLTLSKSLFLCLWRLNHLALEEGSFLFAFVAAHLGSLLIDILNPVLITSPQFKVTWNSEQQDFSTT